MEASGSENPKIDTTNIQGDIWPGLPKKYQKLYFFTITSEYKFRTHLARLIPEITTAEQTVQDRGKIRQHKIEVSKGNRDPGLLNLNGVNISFTRSGIGKLGKHDLDSKNFEKGMLADCRFGNEDRFGRDDPNDWEDRFKTDGPWKKPIDGVILVTGENESSTQSKLKSVLSNFQGWLISSIEHLFTLDGHERHGGKEHFGYKDGISQPKLVGLDNPGEKDPMRAPPGIIINGHQGELHKQPDWAKDGSFFVFRKLQQYVPEFQNWVDETAPNHKLSSDQLGARLVGRWKSGAPVCMTPWKDDPSLANENGFDYTPLEKQDKCPFAAHTRKSNPRADDPKAENNFIYRRGIAYGDEVSNQEWKDHKTSKDRGLLFMCYQSSIYEGFYTQQLGWCNVNYFPFNKENETGEPGPGFDAICGQQNPTEQYDVSVCDGNSENCRIPLKSCVTPRGGEYFFSPSIKALKDFTRI